METPTVRAMTEGEHSQCVYALAPYLKRNPLTHLPLELLELARWGTESKKYDYKNRQFVPFIEELCYVVEGVAVYFTCEDCHYPVFQNSAGWVVRPGEFCLPDDTWVTCNHCKGLGYTLAGL